MTNSFEQVQFVTIDEENHLQRVDNYLISKMKGVPKSKIYRILRKGEVRVNKKRVKPEYKLKIDDHLRIPPVRLDEAPVANLNTDKLAFIEKSVIFEDERLIVMNKPSVNKEN